ncbi:HEAT repeat domain-containing protein, partial [Myxococcota bacterium]|nr:HEAT repeat domain-containing protein [Myxococcota bacterium]
MKYRFLSLILVLSFVATGCNQPRYQGRTLSSWMTDLDDDTDYKRRHACEAIGEMGKEGEGAIDAIILRLDDVNEGVQEFCSEALSKIGPA